MKYGQQFQAQSVPQWAPYNVDYNELKNIIKTNTTRGQAQAIAIPGQADYSLQKFEESFFIELANQHDRVGLFVKSKAEEIGRRLQFFQKSVLRLLARCSYNNAEGKPISAKKREKFAKYDTQIERCGEDIRSLQRFVAAQRVAFYKILKKYKKWTGSASLGSRFNDQILGDPKSFVRRDFEPLLKLYNETLTSLRASAPDMSHYMGPSSTQQNSPETSRRPSAQISPLSMQRYWNEYDNGSEAGDQDQPYTVLIDPDSEGFPGEKIWTYLVVGVTKPVASLKSWLHPSTAASERRPLLSSQDNTDPTSPTSINDTDADEAYSSSEEFPSGYAAHYSTFPSVSDQKLSRHHEKMLSRITLGSYIASLVMLLVSGILVATGRRKLRVEVDAGVIVGVLASLFSAIMAISAMLYRRQPLGWLYWTCSWFTFISICVLDAMLIIIVGNSGH